MNSSLKLFSIRGIALRVHITFPLILIWSAFQYGSLGGGGLTGALFGIITVTLLFVLVTLHELGHSFAALHYGVPVEQIVLLPIGGVAQLKRMPRSPKQEFVIALAGPAVNVALALLMWGTAVSLGFGWFNPLSPFTNGISLTFASIYNYIFFYNVILAVFNMFPAFPMDGGRVLRSLLAMRLNYGKATSIAVRIGRGLAWVMGIYGLFNGGFLLVLIAYFIHNGATQEGRLVQYYEKIRGMTVHQAFSPQVAMLSPDDTIQRALTLRLMENQSNFPVFHQGNMVGFLTEQDLLTAFRHRGANTLVSSVMSPQIAPVSLDSELADAHQRMQTEQLSALPVMDGLQFFGIITLRQIHALLQNRTRPDWVMPTRSM
ncbi:MAG: CBS domain-containing protein [Chloroflexi bacterium]|nr:CBS domain-containing protein [Chloroflexota bacterium]